MQINKAPRIQRLLHGLKSLLSGTNQFTYLQDTKPLVCRIDLHWLKKLSSLSQVTLEQLCSRFSKYSVLDEEQLGRRSLEIVFSGDGQFVIKAVTILDVKKLEKILDDYITYFRTNPHSLIAPILRVFTVKTPDLSVHDYFILMESVRPVSEHFSYDVKGLLQGRSKGVGNHSSFGKDYELVNSQHIELLRMTEMQSLWEQLEDDVCFLCQNNIMDYSLLISFFRREGGKAVRGQVSLQDGSFCAIGIIDYLQEYNTIKRMAGVLKGFFKATEVSATDCEAYAKRMLMFVSKHMKNPVM